MNSSKTESWLAESMQSATSGVQATDDLLTDVVAAGARRRRQRQVLQGIGVAATVVVVGALVATSGVLRDEGASTAATLSNGEVVADLYFVTPNQEHIVSVPTTIRSTGEPGLDAVSALMVETAGDEALKNGFNTLMNQPIAEVNAVKVTDDLITVDLSGLPGDTGGERQFVSPSGDLWDPYPTVDCDCISGEILMQQLVWTVQSALHSNAPVLLLEDGATAKGLWLYGLDGPVKADANVVQSVSTSS